MAWAAMSCGGALVAVGLIGVVATGTFAAVGLVGVAAVAASSGAPVGGLLVGLDWRWIFLVNVPIGIAVVVAGRALLPEIRAERGARLPDPFSVAAVFLAIAAVVLVTVDGSSWGWTSGAEIALYAVTAILVAAAPRDDKRSLGRGGSSSPITRWISAYPASRNCSLGIGVVPVKSSYSTAPRE